MINKRLNSVLDAYTIPILITIGIIGSGIFIRAIILTDKQIDKSYKLENTVNTQQKNIAILKDSITNYKSLLDSIHKRNTLQAAQANGIRKELSKNMKDMSSIEYSIRKVDYINSNDTLYQRVYKEVLNDINK